MKNFLIKIAVFVSPLLIMAYPLDSLLSKKLEKSKSFADGEFPGWNKLLKRGINSDLVIYGSSRALKHFDPVMISDSLHITAYNLGVNGHSFYSQYFRHKLLLKYNKKPRIIIQSLDITSFEIESDFYNPDQYLPYMLNNTELEHNVHNEFSYLDYRLPLIRYYGKKEAFLESLKMIFFPSFNKPVRILGFRSLDFTWNNDLLKAQQRFGSIKVKPDSALIKLFERFLKECTEQNIKVVLVNSPVYIEGQNLISNWPDIMAMYYGFSKKYGIPLIDYADDSISLCKDYFYNSQHLNKKGAEIFTAKLIKDLRKIKDFNNMEIMNMQKVSSLSSSN